MIMLNLRLNVDAKSPISIVTEVSFDVFNNTTKKESFVKLECSERCREMMAEMESGIFSMYSVILSLLCEGINNPTIELLAESQGVSKIVAAKRMEALKNYRWNGQPVLFVN